MNTGDINDNLDTFDETFDRLIKNAKEDIKNIEKRRIEQHKQYLRMKNIWDEMQLKKGINID
jgi:hypothetical protein